MRTHRVDLEAPFRGAPQTVALIKQYALEAQRDPRVRLLAEEICSNLGSKDYVSEILAIYYFVLANTRYMNDPRTIELVRRPERIVRELEAGKTPSLDCDDMVCLQAALLLSVGRECRIKVLAFRNAIYKGERQFSHVVVTVREPRTNSWVTLDPVAAEKTGSMLQRVKHARIYPIA